MWSQRIKPTLELRGGAVQFDTPDFFSLCSLQEPVLDPVLYDNVTATPKLPQLTYMTMKTQAEDESVPYKDSRAEI